MVTIYHSVWLSSCYDCRSLTPEQSRTAMERRSDGEAQHVGRRAPGALLPLCRPSVDEEALPPPDRIGGRLTTLSAGSATSSPLATLSPHSRHTPFAPFVPSSRSLLAPSAPPRSLCTASLPLHRLSPRLRAYRHSLHLALLASRYIVAGCSLEERAALEPTLVMHKRGQSHLLRVYASAHPFCTSTHTPALERARLCSWPSS